MPGLIDSATGLSFGTGLQFQTKIGGSGLAISGGLPAPLAYYKLNDGSGTVATDSSGNGFNLAGGPGTWGPGKFNGGAVFAGAGNFQSSAFTPPNGGPYSVAGWLFLNLGVTVSSGWFGLGNVGANDQELILRVTNSGTGLLFSQFNDDLAVTGLADVRGTFVHVVATMDSNKNQTLYLNGSQVGTRVATAFLNANANLFLGREPVSDFWTGTLDEIRVYSVALTPTQVTQLFNLVPGP